MFASKSPITMARGVRRYEDDVSLKPGGSKSSWHNTAMFLLILASLTMFGTIAYIITLQDITNSAISYITGLLITVTGVLLGLSGLTQSSRSLERMKLQATLTITTLLWLVAVIMIAQSYGFSFTISTIFLRYLFLTGVALFTILVVLYSSATIEATRQRLLAEQAAKAS